METCWNCWRVVGRRNLVVDWRELVGEYVGNLCKLSVHHVQVGGGRGGEGDLTSSDWTSFGRIGRHLLDL